MSALGYNNASDDPAERARCDDCGCCLYPEHWIMYDDAVWVEANGEGRGLLCWWCVEERIGYRLTHADVAWSLSEIDTNWYRP